MKTLDLFTDLIFGIFLTFCPNVRKSPKRQFINQANLPLRPATCLRAFCAVTWFLCHMGLMNRCSKFCNAIMCITKIFRLRKAKLWKNFESKESNGNRGTQFLFAIGIEHGIHDCQVLKYQPLVTSRLIFQCSMIINGIYGNIILDITDGWCFRTWRSWMPHSMPVAKSNWVRPILNFLSTTNIAVNGLSFNVGSKILTGL